jgi:hypothetical protein
MAGGLAGGYPRRMPYPSFSTQRLQRCLDRLQEGDRTARDELLRRVGGRLERLARKLLRRFPGVRRWTETGEVRSSNTREYRVGIITPLTLSSDQRGPVRVVLNRCRRPPSGRQLRRRSHG